MSYHKSSKIGILKFFVYTMGLVLMVGIIAIVSILYKQTQPGIKAFSEMLESEKLICQDLSARITLDSSIDRVEQFDNRLMILTKPIGNVQRILIFDYCQNKVVTDLDVEIHTNANNPIESAKRTASDETVVGTEL